MNYEVFEQGWEGDDTVCGWGSQIEHTESIRERLPEIVETLGIKTINDAGCGDFWWMREVNFVDDVDYLGYDIYDRTHKQDFAFQKLDIVKEDMRPCDLIICRDVFIHLPNRMVIEALERFKRVGKFLLSTTFDITHNDGRMAEPQLQHNKLNLRLSPFNLHHALGCIHEDSPGKLSGLWDLRETT